VNVIAASSHAAYLSLARPSPQAGKGRTGMMIAALLLHCGFRSSAEAALRYFGYARTANGKGVTIPSQMRYVHYYEAMLRAGPPLVHAYRVTHIRLRGTPTADKSSAGFACVPHFTLAVDGDVVFDYAKALAAHAAAGGRVPPGVGADGRLRRYRKGEPYVDFDVSWAPGGGVVVAGNVKLQLLHDKGAAAAAAAGGSKPGKAKAGKLCHLWFHTGFVTRCYLAFGKGVVDKANKDKKGTFPANFAVEFLLERVAGPSDEGWEGGAGESGGSGAAGARAGTLLPAAVASAAAAVAAAATPARSGGSGAASGGDATGATSSSRGGGVRAAATAATASAAPLSPGPAVAPAGGSGGAFGSVFTSLAALGGGGGGGGGARSSVLSSRPGIAEGSGTTAGATGRGEWAGGEADAGGE